MICNPMKNTFILLLLATITLLAACNNKNENKTGNVDWDSPLYQLNAQGDTLSVWEYETTEQGRTVTKIDLPSDYGDGTSTEIYDRNDRLVGTISSLNTGNIHNTNMAYSYQGKTRIAEGSESTEGFTYFYYIKEVTYYLDDEYKYDTLIQQFVKEMDWESDYDEDEEALVGPLTSFTRKLYETTKNGGYQLIESNTFASSTVNPEEVNVEYSYKIKYQYNDKGQLVSEKLYDRNGKLGYETTYSYQDNKRIERADGEECTTYFKIKQ